MGQEASVQIDPSTPPDTLSARTLEAAAQYILSGKVKRIVVMVGAGISTAAGIPDFRSPDTGLYANLARLDLPFAEAVFDISYFRNNPAPFYTLAHDLYPGLEDEEGKPQYRPTLAHAFLKLLYDKGLLLKLFTQNIDCLERAAGVPGEMIVEAHGSFATQRCIECRTPYPDDLMRKAINEKEVPHCNAPECNGLVKPDIVFFGEQLPESFFLNRQLPAAADFCLVMGTSLSVQPFASLPGFCSQGVPRLLINKDQVGTLGCRADDVLLLGDCDDGVRKLADALGWGKELDQLWKSVGGRSKEEVAAAEEEKNKNKTKDERLEDEIEKLTKDVDQSLKVSSEHTERVKSQLARDDAKRVAADDAKHENKTTEDELKDAATNKSQPEKLGEAPDTEAKPDSSNTIDKPSERREETEDTANATAIPITTTPGTGSKPVL